MSELRVRVLVALGWKWAAPYSKRKASNVLVAPGGRQTLTAWRDGDYGGTAPDHTKSLDLCATLRASLTEEERQAYAFALAKIVDTYSKDDTLGEWFALANATAEQHCRAFLAAKGA